MSRCGVWLILLLIVFGLSACTTPKQVCPDDGVWYCEELQAQFYMNWEDDFADDECPIADETITYVIVNGDRIAAGCGYYKWSEVISIHCLEQNHPVYDFGEDIYSMEFVRLTDTEYVLKDDEGNYYTFIRIGDAPVKDNDAAQETAPTSPDSNTRITYSDEQLSEIAESEMTKDQLVGQYPATYTRTVSIVQDDISNATSAVAVHYWGETKVLQLIFDNASGSKIWSYLYSAVCAKEEFDALAAGQTLSDVQAIDPEGEYLFLYTGRNDVPRVSTHYTTDGFVIRITYNQNYVIEKIDIASM